VSEKSFGKRVKVLVDAIPKEHTWLPDGTPVPLCGRVRNCGSNEPVGRILLRFKMPKWKSWLEFRFAISLDFAGHKESR